MRTNGTAARLTILVDENDDWHHRPLYAEIVHRAHAGGLAGATVLRGIEGYAGVSGIHTTHLFRHGDHVPVMITIIDRHDRLRTFLHELDEIMHKGVALFDDVEVIVFHRDALADPRSERGGRTGGEPSGPRQHRTAPPG